MLSCASYTQSASCSPSYFLTIGVAQQFVSFLETPDQRTSKTSEWHCELHPSNTADDNNVRCYWDGRKRGPSRRAVGRNRPLCQCRARGALFRHRRIDQG